MQKSTPEEEIRRIGEQLKKSQGDPQLADVGTHFFDLNGGAKGVAQKLADLASKDEISPTSKIRIFDIVLRGVGRTNDRRPTPTEFSQLTDDELDAEIRASENRIAELIAQKMSEPDVVPMPPPPPPPEKKRGRPKRNS